MIDLVGPQTTSSRQLQDAANKIYPPSFFRGVFPATMEPPDDGSTHFMPRRDGGGAEVGGARGGGSGGAAAAARAGGGCSFFNRCVIQKVQTVCYVEVYWALQIARKCGRQVGGID